MASSGTSALLYAATVATPTTTPSRPEDEITKAKGWHVKSGGFDNPWPSWTPLVPFSIMKGMVARRFNGKANHPDTTPPTVPVQMPTFLSSRDTPKLRTTWLGHACYLVEFPSGLRVLFDPVFEDRCSPFSWLGPKRYTPPPCAIKDIPTIDAVVISHNHYDHLSHPTIVEISKTHPNVHFFVPLGNKKWFASCGITQCTELDWWDQIELTLIPKSSSRKPSANSPRSSTTTSTTHDPNQTITATISCLPCQHISARSIHDRAATLWSSWSVVSGGKSLYFAGDTGYRAVPFSSDGKDDWGPEYSDLPHCPAFADVGAFRGPFDVGLIPIGAYMPRWIMSPMHANPRDSVEIFRDTKCKKALGMHWGTWVLTEEDVLEPPKLLKKALAHHGIAETGVFDICDIGESREFD
jgi:N-acyl-phosphatidylethanolamine-hydrolysing phospholipase D